MALTGEKTCQAPGLKPANEHTVSHKYNTLWLYSVYATLS